MNELTCTAFMFNCPLMMISVIIKKIFSQTVEIYIYILSQYNTICLKSNFCLLAQKRRIDKTNY